MSSTGSTKSYYETCGPSVSAIPTLVFLDRKGNVVYNRAGETARERADASVLEEILKKAMATRP